MSSGEGNSNAERQVSSRGNTRRAPACARAPNAPAPSTPRPYSAPGARTPRQQKDRTPRGKRGGMKRMSDQEMMQVEVKREREIEKRQCGGSSSVPSRRGIAAAPTRLDLGGTKRPHSSLDGGGGSGSGSDSKVSVSVSVGASQPPKKKKTKKKTRTPAGAGSNASSSPPSSLALAAHRPRQDHAITAAGAAAGAAGTAAGAAAPGGVGSLSVHPAGAARRGGRGAGGDGAEVVRHVSVEERIAENLRRRGMIDVRDGDGLAPRAVPLTAARARPIPPISAARAAARRGGGSGIGSGSGSGSGGGGATRGGGVSCNLAVAEGWTPAAPSSVSVPVKLEASAAQGAGNNILAGPPAPGPAPAATPPPVSSGGGGRKVSVSDIFRMRGVRYDIRVASKVGILAKKMYVEERGKPAGKMLRKRPALDRYMNEVPAPWRPDSSVPENAYLSCYRGMLLEAFDAVVGRAP